MTQEQARPERETAGTRTGTPTTQAGQTLLASFSYSLEGIPFGGTLVDGELLDARIAAIEAEAAKAERERLRALLGPSLESIRDLADRAVIYDQAEALLALLSEPA